MKRLRQLEDENVKLKRIVADLSLDKAMLQDVLSKSFEAWPQARTCRQGPVGMEGVDQARLCSCVYRNLIRVDDVMESPKLAE
jgi:hypothetical protein